MNAISPLSHLASDAMTWGQIKASLRSLSRSLPEGEWLAVYLNVDKDGTSPDDVSTAPAIAHWHIPADSIFYTTRTVAVSDHIGALLYHTRRYLALAPAERAKWMPPVDAEREMREAARVETLSTPVLNIAAAG